MVLCFVMLRMVVTQLHPGKLERLRDWCAQLMGPRKREAEESLRREGVTRENAFLVTIGGKPYVIHVVESGDVPKPADLSLPVNVEHRRVNREVMDLGSRVKAELLYDISASV